MTNFIAGLGMPNIPQVTSGFVSPMSGSMGSLGSMGAIDAPQQGNFKNIMSNMAGNLNQTVSAPDQLLKDSVAGNGVDIHDVVLAMNKAELGVNIATQLTTKIVQSYEKIMAIQI